MLVPPIICSKCKIQDEKIFKEEESIEILKILGFINSLKIYNYFNNMVDKNISQDFKLKNIDETRNYFLEEIQQNKLRSKKHKKEVSTTLNYIEHFLILHSAVTGCISVLLLLFCLVFL